MRINFNFDGQDLYALSTEYVGPKEAVRKSIDRRLSGGQYLHTFSMNSKNLTHGKVSSYTYHGTICTRGGSVVRNAVVTIYPSS